MTHHHSECLLSRAEKLLPGGVNSPVRAFRAVGGKPPFIKSAQGAWLTDEDGHRYLDYVGSWGPAILGHTHPKVVEAVERAARDGLSFGAPTAGEVALAELVSSRYPSMEMMRCVSSGTEATMSALRVARGFTGRELVLKFEGGYHGHADPFLVRAGSGAATFGSPDSAGVPESVARLTLTLPYNDIHALQQLVENRGRELSAIIVEPVAGNMGCIPPCPLFLETICELCRTVGALSIFDEVMTGSRLALGGAQQRYLVRPDLTCLGKVVGGGLPLAIYGGRGDAMRMVAPLGPVYQAGTLSGNPLAVAAGLATLTELEEGSYERLEHLGAKLEMGLKQAIADTGTEAQVSRVGSMFTVFFGPSPIHDFASANRCDRARFARFHQGLLTRGVYFPPSQLEAAFVSLAHTDADIETTIRIARNALTD
jgi:glutamate-1-semialdehyde 2,1-aminomutase